MDTYICRGIEVDETAQSRLCARTRMLKAPIQYRVNPARMGGRGRGDEGMGEKRKLIGVQSDHGMCDRDE